MIYDDIVKCSICNKDKLFREIVDRLIVKGEKVYICKDCREEMREFKNKCNTQLQRDIDEQHRY